MPGGNSIWDNLRSGVQSDQEIAYKILFPGKNQFQMLQMLNEQTPGAIMPWSVLGVFRRYYKSKVLTTLQEEHMVNKISDNRKGRLEGSEIAASRRIEKEDRDE